MGIPKGIPKYKWEPGGLIIYFVSNFKMFRITHWKQRESAITVAKILLL